MVSRIFSRCLPHRLYKRILNHIYGEIDLINSSIRHSKQKKDSITSVVESFFYAIDVLYFNSNHIMTTTT